MMTLADRPRTHIGYGRRPGQRRPYIALKHWPHVHQAVALNDPSKILVVEEDDDLRSQLARSLRQEGYSVSDYGGGRELLDLIDLFDRAAFLEDFDLIIADSSTPGFCGATILNWLCEHGYGPPLILITSADERRTYAAANQHYRVGTLDKPFEIGELMDKVHELLF